MPVSEALFLTALLAVGLLLLTTGYAAGRRLAAQAVNRAWQDRLPLIRKEAVQRSRAVLRGRFSEHLAPYLPDFPFSPTEARFLGEPVDFVVFRGLDRKAPFEVVFVEVKSGRAALSPVQRRLRDAVERGQVRWTVYRAPGEGAPERLDRYPR